MIPWTGVAANALWILGVTLALAVVSHAVWKADLEDERLRHMLDRPTARRALALSGLVFCAGLAASSGLNNNPLLETGLWLLLALAFLAQLIIYWRQPSPD